MYGAILGDIVGSPYEFDCNNYKAKDFPLFSRRSDFTDDTVMTLAVAKAHLAASLSAGGEPSRDVTLTDGSYVWLRYEAVTAESLED